MEYYLYGMFIAFVLSVLKQKYSGNKYEYMDFVIIFIITITSWISVLLILLVYFVEAEELSEYYKSRKICKS